MGFKKKEIIFLASAVFIVVALVMIIFWQQSNYRELKFKYSQQIKLQEYALKKRAFEIKRKKHQHHAKSVESMAPRHILIKKIEVKYDTITKRVIDSSYIYQLQYLRAKLNGFYNSEPGH